VLIDEHPVAGAQSREHRGPGDGESAEAAANAIGGRDSGGDERGFEEDGRDPPGATAHALILSEARRISQTSATTTLNASIAAATAYMTRGRVAAALFMSIPGNSKPRDSGESRGQRSFVRERD
jgi:hypothetical protein